MEKKLNKILLAFLLVGASKSMMTDEQKAIELSLVQNPANLDPEAQLAVAIVESLETDQKEKEARDHEFAKQTQDQLNAEVFTEDDQDPHLRRALRLSAAESRIKKTAAEVMSERRANTASASASSQARSSHEQPVDRAQKRDAVVANPGQNRERLENILAGLDFFLGENALTDALNQMELFVVLNEGNLNNENMRGIVQQTQNIVYAFDHTRTAEVHKKIERFKLLAIESLGLK